MEVSAAGVPSGMSDADLVAACRSGNEQAWAELVERFSRYVYAITSRAFSLPRDVAEDVFQEVFARTYENLDKLRDDAAIRPWIGQMTRRLCIDQLRSGGREMADDEIELGASDEEMARIEEALTVRAGLAQLGENCQEILDRFFAQDQSYATIGEELRIPAGTIASRISRCLSKLRTALEGREPVSAPSGVDV